MKNKKKGFKKFRLGSQFSLLMRSRFSEKKKDLKKYNRKIKHRKRNEED